MERDDIGAGSDGRETSELEPVLIVALGASAGGLEALQQFFGALTELDDAAFIVVQHLDPSSRSLLPELLGRATTMPVAEITDGMAMRRAHVYVAPSQGVVHVEEGRLRVRLALEDRRGAIDECLTSLAHVYGPRAVGIVLSGSGSDGTLGLQAIHRVGGMTMAQDDASARYDAMPRNAVTSGVVDHALAPVELAAEVVAYARHVRGLTFDVNEQSATRLEEVLPEICKALESGTSHGLHQYKASTLVRRIQRRMQILRVGDPDAYLTRLREDRDEAHLLLRELLISVTAFFRDAEAFAVLAEKVIRPLTEGRSPDEQIRIWVPGCATGEEAYSIAMLVREALEHHERPPTVQIFATDIDERALAFAREGAYPVRIAEVVSHERLERFFVRRGMRYQVKPELREMCLFSAHNLVADPPFSRLDLISCRNVLIYLGVPLQQKLVSIFHYALRSQGFLFLGPSENIAAHTELFRAVSAKHRISQRKATPLRAPGLAGSSGSYRMTGIPGLTGGERPDLHLIGQRILLDEFAPSYVIVDEQGQVLVSSARVERYLEFGEGPFQNNVVRLSRAGLRTTLRQALAEAIESRKKVVRPAVPLHTSTSPERVGITVQPMPRMGESDDLFMVVFQESEGDRDARPVQADPTSESVIEELERELATTRDDLERSIQDLESANEELKSSNEELLSMNEELQSANEELESSKEEVQAGNDALARSHADLENLLASSEIATIFLDDQLRVQRFTPPATAIYNLLPVDLGRPLADITHNATDMPAMTADVGGAPREIHTNDARLFLRRVLPYRTHEGKQEGIVVTFADVTELRGHQELVRRHVAELEAIYASAPIALAVLDPDLRYHRVNRFLAALDGVSIDEHLGRTPAEIVGELGTQAEEAMRKVLRTGEAVEQIESRGTLHGQEQVRSSSYTAIKDSSGRTIGINAVVQDVTARSREQQDLRESERMARAVADAAPVLIWMAGGDTSFVFVNQRWLDFTGRPLEAEVGTGWCEGVHPEDRERCIQTFANAFARRESFELELRLLRRDGEYRWVLNRGVPRYGYDRGFEGYIGGCIDVTDRLRAELELAEAKRLADAANRAKSDFLANMSHEIRTPLTAVLGYADVLADRTTDLEARRCIEIIKRNGVYLVQIVNDILDLSKIEAGKLAPEHVRFSPGEVLVDLYGLLRGRADERGLTLGVEAVGPLPSTILGDPTRLRQILINLVGNGIKFTSMGSVNLTAQLLGEREELLFKVIDTGIGMDAEIRARLFEPFSQADTSNKRAYGGTGLGLAISKRLVEALGGRIWVDSEPRMGSTFAFTIPTGPLAGVELVHGLPEPAPTTPPSPAKLADLKGCRILIVDDRSDVRELMQGYLEASGAKVFHASDGVSALVRYDVLNAAGTPPVAIVLDMQMPVLDGYETAERLRAAGYRGSIIAVTASAMKGDRERCLAAGCDDYLTKPITRETLVDRIACHCGDAQRRMGGEQVALRVLVVDDDEDAAEAVAARLASGYVEIRVAFSGESAIAAAAEFLPDAVVLDLGLPDLDGYQVAARLRAAAAHAEALLIALSGHGQDEDIARSRDAGFDHHLTKPPDFQRLRGLLESKTTRR